VGRVQARRRRPPADLGLLCLAVDYGTTNPLHAVLLGLGVNDTLYVVAEWRWDSRTEGRQFTDIEYSRRLRDWISTVKLPASEIRGPKPRFAVIDPSAASFKVQMYQDGWPTVDGDNAVVDGIRLISTLLSVDRLKIHKSCKGLIAEVPGYSWSEAQPLVRSLAIRDQPTQQCPAAEG
jgi:hypothetical protein